MVVIKVKNKHREEDPVLKNGLEVGYTGAGEIGRSRGQKPCSPQPIPIARSDGVLRSPPPLEVRGRALILGSVSMGSHSWIGVPPTKRAQPWRLGRRWMAEVAASVRRRSNDILMAVEW